MQSFHVIRTAAGIKFHNGYTGAEIVYIFFKKISKWAILTDTMF